MNTNWKVLFSILVLGVIVLLPMATIAAEDDISKNERRLLQEQQNALHGIMVDAVEKAFRQTKLSSWLLNWMLNNHSKELEQDLTKAIFLLIQEKAKKISSESALELLKDGLQMEKDVGFSPSITVEQLKSLKILPIPDEASKTGKEMMAYAKQQNANLGIEHAKWLYAHSDQIPQEWKNFVMIFPGSITAGMDEMIICLAFFSKDERWHIYFRIVDAEWGKGYYRLVTLE